MSGRIRSIKPELLDDELAAELPDAAWRLWVSSWVLADDYGRFRAGAKLLAAHVWHDTRKAKVVEKCLAKLAEIKFLRIYEVDGQQYAELKQTGWRRHQRIDHPGKPRVPAPNESGTLPTVPREPSDDEPKDSETFGEPRPSRARARPPTTTTTTTAEGEPPAAVGNPKAAIEATLERWPSTRSLAIHTVAETLAERFATLELSKGTKLEWYLAALGEAAADGVGLNAEALTKKLRSYGDRARPPRPAVMRPADAGDLDVEALRSRPTTPDKPFFASAEVLAERRRALGLPPEEAPRG
jgi:hypothetical protein